MSQDENSARPFWQSAAGLFFVGFGAVAAYLLITEHWAHIVAGNWLIWLLPFACLAMHFFHGGHSGHGRHGHSSPKEE
jgi:hypothetical protein